jgi:CubicO group peptidase (beta-lactamase class C family)
MDMFEAVAAAREEHGVPGVAVGLLEDGVERHEAYGVTSIENPLEVTPDTRFQVGSITKTFTGTVVCELVARGELELDRPVREYVPGLALADTEATERVTMRHCSRIPAAGSATTSTTRAGATTRPPCTWSACGTCRSRLPSESCGRTTTPASRSRAVRSSS